MNHRIKQLDVIRAIAILLVLGRHAPFSPVGPCPITTWLPLKVFLYYWYQCGWAGVDLFFVLSGYLVSGLIFREQIRSGSINLKRFYIRRGLKIYPPFYVLLLATAVSYLTPFRLGMNPLGLKEFLSEAFFIQNYGPHLWVHTWSLAVEEHFYILLGIGLLLLYRRNRKKEDPFSNLVFIFPFVAVLVLGLRFINESGSTQNWRLQIAPTHLRLDSLLFGVFLSYLSHYRKEVFVPFVVRYRWLILPISAALVSPCVILPISNYFMHTAGLSCAYLGFGGLLVLSLNWPSSPRSIKAFSWITGALAIVGFNSYSIYLWHSAVLQINPVIQKHILGHFLPYLASTAIFVIGSIMVGIFMAKIIEFPFLRLRDNICPSKHTILAASDLQK